MWAHILSRKSSGRRVCMKECDDFTVDLEDLIFDDEEYAPSER